MLQFRNLRFRTKFAILIGFVLAGLALLGWVSFDTLTQVEVNGVLYQELARGARIGTDFNASSEYLVESEMDAYRLTTVQNPAVRARVLKDFDGARRRFEQRHAYWLKHAPDRAEGALITGAVAQAGEQYFSIADSQFLPAVERGDLSTAATVLEGPMRAAFRLNRDAAERVMSMNESYRAQMESQAAAIVARRKHVLEGVILLVLAGVLLLGLAMARSVTGAMDESVEVLNAVAAGELTRRLNLHGEDEIGQMARSLNQAIDSMHETVMALTQGAQNIASASEEISANASQTAQGADLQKDQSAQVATAMQEMTATVQEVAANAHNVAEAAHEASRSARHGGTVVEQTVGRIRTVAATLQSSSQAMQALGQRSSEIGTIIEVIDDIADQTNLLALNAAIEAARAGDQGRGFAVVADEVRKLAERTATATREIGGMISSMQKETREAVAAMLAGNKQMEEGVTTAAEAGQAIAEIVAGIDRVNSMVAQIAAASSQQSAATDQVNQSMERIAHISGEAAVGAQQAARACQDLSHLALDLQNLVARFQVASSHHEGRGGWRQAAPRTLAAAQA